MISEGKDQNSDSDDFENNRYTKEGQPAPWEIWFQKLSKLTKALGEQAEWWEIKN